MSPRYRASYADILVIASRHRVSTPIERGGAGSPSQEWRSTSRDEERQQRGKPQRGSGRSKFHDSWDYILDSKEIPWIHRRKGVQVPACRGSPESGEQQSSPHVLILPRTTITSHGRLSFLRGRMPSHSRIIRDLRISTSCRPP
jgi:hypothetical protein